MAASLLPRPLVALPTLYCVSDSEYLCRTLREQDGGEADEEVKR